MCPYGMSKCQFHNHVIQNAHFKCQLVDVKQILAQRRCEAGLPADLFVKEIPVMVKEVSDETYAHVEYAQKCFDSWDTHRSLMQYWMMLTYFHRQAKKSSKSVA